MKSGSHTYQTTIKKGFAFMFLLLFLNGFVAESIAYGFKDICQSELIDFENEKDSEEDSKKEKEKENKILTVVEALADIDRNLMYQGPNHFLRLNEEIQEVLSPPPDLG